MQEPIVSGVVEAEADLNRIFSHYYWVRTAQDAEPVQARLLPSYEMLLVFNFGPPVPVQLGDFDGPIGQTAVFGPLQKVLSYQLGPDAELIVVNFTLNGFYRLLQIPVQQLRSASFHHPDELLQTGVFGELWQELAGQPTLEARLTALSTFIRRQIAPVEAEAEVLLDSIVHFRNATVDPVKALAQANRLSDRSIQLRFQKQLGFSARELVRFLRFKKVLQLLSQPGNASPDWMAVVQRFGYHDQSHLIKDFRFYLGVSPRQYLAYLREGELCISQSGRHY